LTGHSLEDIQAIVQDGGVELKDGYRVLIEKGSLYAFKKHE